MNILDPNYANEMFAATAQYTKAENLLAASMLDNHNAKKSPAMPDVYFIQKAREFMTSAQTRGENPVIAAASEMHRLDTQSGLVGKKEDPQSK